MVGIGNRGFRPSSEIVHVFIDLSNVFAGARDAARDRGEYSADVRLHADNILDLLSRARHTATRLVVANAEVPSSVLNRFALAGFEIETREVGHHSRTEQANDELLQNRMLMIGTEHSKERGAIVLATGDGNGWLRNRGFCPVLERVAEHGWRIEVASWKCSLNPQLAETVHLRRGRVELLDESYYAITFVEGGRRAQPIIHYPETPAA